ncbi:MAG: hypothetical protein O3A00_18455 [Planctomycetota bacterium]|nr:hypothetical protein [Planctomycetota bacterium]
MIIPKDVDAAIGSAVRATATLAEHASHDTAHDACFELREATQIFFFAFGDYGEHASTKTQELQDALVRAKTELARACESELANDPLVAKYLRSVRWRCEFVDALVSRKPKLVRELLEMKPEQ